nr:PEP-CTERM sorting domain-containing protein [uncultured Massilia sp.]
MKHLISTCALLACSALAQAQTTHWTFSYTGFYDREAATFLSDMHIDGSFTGVDANLDGVLERSELTSLLIGTRDYATCAGGAPGSYCGADRFRFSANEGLSFSLGEYGGDPEGWSGGGYLVESGKMSYEYNYNPGGSYEHHLDWTDATTLSMTSVSPSIITSVPEPGEWAMLAAGLAGMCAWSRRRRS